MTRKDPLRQLWRIYIIVCVNFFQQMGLRFKSCATRSRRLLRWWISYRYNISISRRVYYLHNGGQLNYSTNLVDYLSTYALAAWIIHADDSWLKDFKKASKTWKYWSTKYNQILHLVSSNSFVWLSDWQLLRCSSVCI